VNDPKCGKHDDVIDRISALESVVSAQVEISNNTKEQSRINANRIEEISKMHSLLSEVKVEIKHIHKKLDKRSITDILLDAVIQFVIIGTLMAFAYFSFG